LRTLRQTFPALRIHLVGHSFGARLVTAAADASGAEVQPASLLLLQAAFSHNGFAPAFHADGRDYTGFFRRVVQERKVAGPIVITYTLNDKAVGLAYAIASRLAREAVSGLGDAGDLYGGLGRNGAVHMPDAELGGHVLELLAPGGAYSFAAGRVFNLKADRFIDSHSGIRNDAVGYALLRTIT
jgi:pimeloyl-ACP methyl ester carboxylesterase